MKRFEKINEYFDKTILEIEEQIKNLQANHKQTWDELNAVKREKLSIDDLILTGCGTKKQKMNGLRKFRYL